MNTILKASSVIILVIHGTIHLLGFVKAFEYAELKELNLPVTKKQGLVWLLTFVIFLLSATLLVLNLEIWKLSALFAALLSQIVILTSWADAKFGSIINVLVVILLGLTFLF
ncbi:hypothetical protein [Pelagicoccus sp. SDUM812003]|uniref:hypothetical protein n=1 Tax=Pelagicoccus sp. SDUM812003 TaxID=3041267 RepID=UPI00280E9315|nr:hypothetical protein [Pelagicoccus sp. SDUM812003]MDQ8201834.1 hypothetical protein [Pelagicoccus sp. SDUM812003]